MEPNSREFYKQCAFQKFCNTVLHNEACDAHRELHRHKAREVTFSDLPLDEARQSSNAQVGQSPLWNTPAFSAGRFSRYARPP